VAGTKEAWDRLEIGPESSVRADLESCGCCRARPAAPLPLRRLRDVFVVRAAGNADYFRVAWTVQNRRASRPAGLDARVTNLPSRLGALEALRGKVGVGRSSVLWRPRSLPAWGAVAGPLAR